ncbi:GyrI-like domain-containing protein [Lentilactobacillus sp. Marseille-Q4993]|uniref:GyrI-like domain-containing protein n=1 Tax=Lentilactobacillus sp. Marseille-Q4993 TaxID=3039492 RepID=UPI0024BD4948|nr:GyrI-like domain-containing protein [Lentilactobacillus sp. Marseille-Q4993]
MKHEWRKLEKQIYLPKSVAVIEVPNFKFLTLTGNGNPNESEFGDRVGALYALSYAVRFALKKGELGNDPYEYTVYPLEGVWTLPDKPTGEINKDDLIYKIMIRQPDQVTASMIDDLQGATATKKRNNLINDIKFEEYTEDKSIQALHVGPYDSETATFSMMNKQLDELGLKQVPTMGKYQHREIYLSDPRKVAPEKQKTVLRWRVAEK